MSSPDDTTATWRGLRADARRQLAEARYGRPRLAEALTTRGVPAGDLVGTGPGDLEDAWIPGVEVFARTVHPQRHRGLFGEFAREGEGALGRIGLWPRQWAAARMFAPSAKGFHVHPPFVPEGEAPEPWFRRLFLDSEASPADRPYEREQWDVMFIVQGSAEMILVDERAGLERRIMRLFIQGDDCPGPDNAGVVIPPGVAHALRTAGSRDVLMVYGTSTVFDPAAEGRIAAAVEDAPLPAEWRAFLDEETGPEPS